MAMNLNFFDWIRDGVRKSVLLGVSDAVNQIGMPHDQAEVNKRLLGFFREPGGPTANAELPVMPPRKRLGRTLRQVQDGGEKAA